MNMGDCSYLETCKSKYLCKYIHYKVDPQDLMLNLPRVFKMEAYQGLQEKHLSDVKPSQWRAYRPPELELSLKRFRSKLMNSGTAQWINCDLLNFDLKLLVCDPDQPIESVPDLEKFDVMIVDCPWDIRMDLPYAVNTDYELITKLLKDMQHL